MRLPTTTRGEGGWVVHDYDGVAHLAELAAAVGTAAVAGNAREADDFGGARWCNGYTPRLVLDRAKHPPSELVGAVEAARRAIEGLVEPPQRRTRKVYRRLESGDELDPQAWAERRPDGWSEVRATRVPKHVVRVAVNATVSSGRAPGELLWRGAAAVALADLLTDAGHSVEVTLLAAVQRTLGFSGKRGALELARVPVKRADAPLDVAAAALALAEIGFYRAGVIVASMRASGEPTDNAMPMLAPAWEAREHDVVLDSDVFTLERAAEAVGRQLGELA